MSRVMLVRVFELLVGQSIAITDIPVRKRIEISCLA